MPFSYLRLYFVCTRQVISFINDLIDLLSFLPSCLTVDYTSDSFFVLGNLLFAYSIIQRFTFQTVGNATFSVDSFFFLR